MKAIAFDAMGVIYTTSDDVAELLCPFIRNNGGIDDVDKITNLYKAASLGKMSPGAFWKAVLIRNWRTSTFANFPSLTGYSRYC